MVRRNWIKGKPRKRNKTYSERFIDRKGKIIHYVNDANRYKKIVSTGAHEYVKLYLCGTCDGSGFLGNNNCKECNSEEEE